MLVFLVIDQDCCAHKTLGPDRTVRGKVRGDCFLGIRNELKMRDGET
jgi:hypothetical protein